MEDQNEFKSEPTQIEQAKLENLLLQAEYRYGKDIIQLQDALIRARKIGMLHLVGIHLRIVFLTELTNTMPLERALYKWKSKCVTDFVSRNKKLKVVLRSLYLTNITRAFYIMKERKMKARQSLSDHMVEGPMYAQGALSPLSSDDDDLEI